MTNWHDGPVLIAKSADPQNEGGASLEKMLTEVEALLVNGYKLISTTECNGQIFMFLVNDSETKKGSKILILEHSES
jgi:hypothetical protein